MTREDTLRRYRHLRTINKQQQSDALNSVPRKTLLDAGRRLGVVRGRTLVFDNAEDLNLLFDLVVHAGRHGRFRPIDRYADAARPPSGSDEALMLAAARNARFTIVSVERRHEIAGLHVLDVLEDRPLWLIDEGLEASSPDGAMFATRLLTVEDFAMTCGALAPIDEFVMWELLRSAPRSSARSQTEPAQDPRFAAAIYRAAIRTGATDAMAYLDPVADVTSDFEIAS
jgi:hypothetical protein